MRSEQNDNTISAETKEGNKQAGRRRNVVVFGLFIALSSVVYVVEGLIPFPVPGGKWGFSNFLVLYLSYYEGLSDALLLATSKSVLGSILSGTFLTPGFLMGFFGSLSAAFFQSIISRTGIFGIVGISIIGMVANNLAQFLIGSIIIDSSAIYGLLPIVMFLGTFSAIANSYLAKQTSIIRNMESGSRS